MDARRQEATAGSCPAKDNEGYHDHTIPIILQLNYKFIDHAADFLGQGVRI